jgi:DNA-directed RNA polymerase specialized sigma24 family protein
MPSQSSQPTGLLDRRNGCRLQEFEKLAPRQANVVELRYFGALTTDEIAAIMNVSQRTVEHDWQFSRAWLMIFSFRVSFSSVPQGR